MDLSERNQQLIERNKQLIEAFRASPNKADGTYEGRALLLLTTTGAKSGQPRTSPVAYIRDGERLVVIGSNQGLHTHSAWYYNLRAHPQVTVEVGDEKFAATAAEASGEERQRLWQKFVAAMPGFADYQANTTRQLPVIVLTRQG